MKALYERAKALSENMTSQPIEVDGYLHKLIGSSTSDGKALVGEAGLLPVFVVRAKSMCAICLGDGVAQSLFPTRHHQRDRLSLLGVTVKADPLNSSVESMLSAIFLGNSTLQVMRCVQGANGKTNIAPLIGHYGSPQMGAVMLGLEYESLKSEGDLRLLLLSQMLQDTQMPRS